MINFGIKDAIDIFLVALLLYYLYRALRRSSAGNIFGGVLTFILLWVFVRQVFEMRLLGSIFDRLINVGALALIVLFQEELRQFLYNLGTQRARRWFRWLRRHRDGEEPREAFLPLVMACMNMSKQKVGALIVLERFSKLLDVARTGELIDAKLSQRLIESIFFKNSPLHDGAMIIGDRRVKAAGCILPVSHDATIPKHLGLRHRAAMGISEKCDALVIIVSEETGSISVAHQGEFTLRLAAEELERRISKAMSDL